MRALLKVATSSAPPPPPISVAREKLIERVKYTNDLRREVAHLASGFERARQESRSAFARHERLSEDLPQAIADARVRRINDFIGLDAQKQVVGPNERELQDQLEAAAVERDETAAVEREIERRLDVAREHLRIDWLAEHAERVLEAEATPQLAALTDRVERLQADLIDVGGALLFLLGSRRTRSPEGMSPEIARARSVGGRLGMCPESWPGWSASRGWAEWRAVHEALQSDPLTVLPE